MPAIDRCCLITGGAGNLAGPLARALAPDFGRMVLTDVRSEPPAGMAAGAVYEPMDIGDFARLEKLVQTHRPGTIIHLASLLSGSSEKDRRKTWHINTGATLEIIEHALTLPGCRVIFASTAATYGGDLPKVVTEAQSPWPATLYGVTKVACERMGAYAREAHGLDFRCLRLPTILSPLAPPQAVSAMVSRAFVESAQSGRFTFRAGPDMRMATMYVKDVIGAFVTLARAPREQIRQAVYTIAGFSATMGEFSAAIKKRLPDVVHEFKPEAEVEGVLSRWPQVLDDTAARRDWNWQPAYDLDATAEDFLS